LKARTGLCCITALLVNKPGEELSGKKLHMRTSESYEEFES